ncbi:hypothetical protein OAO01_00040 [Oligoflexia bacterium]|nr:hypothetical protein [Oligoflexia bacterium]
MVVMCADRGVFSVAYLLIFSSLIAVFPQVSELKAEEFGPNATIEAYEFTATKWLARPPGLDDQLPVRSTFSIQITPPSCRFGGSLYGSNEPTYEGTSKVFHKADVRNISCCGGVGAGIRCCVRIKEGEDFFKGEVKCHNPDYSIFFWYQERDSGTPHDIHNPYDRIGDEMPPLDDSR